jgi:NAD(P)-dependent dehydrogenase (short-subunit alcohol dehydrogenase family)
VSGRVLVTGAGSGLGKAIAMRFAAGGYRTLVSDVDGEAAEAVARGIDAEFLPLDVTDPDAWERARAWCAENWDGVDVLVNNAGVAGGGRFERITLADWDWIWDINFKGVLHGCRAFVPEFKARGAGHLVNVASLAGIMNLPAMASYNVSKAAVISLSETLRNELTPYGVHTTVVCPAYVRTNLGDRMRSPDAALIALLDKLMTSSPVTPADVADQVFDAVARKRFLVLTHRDGRQSWLLKRYLPKVVEARVAKYWDRLRSAVEREDA